MGAGGIINASYMICRLYLLELLTRTKQAQNKLAAAQTKMERSITSGSGRGQKSDIISNVIKTKWSWAGHINPLKNDRWTSSVTTWRPYDKKRRQAEETTWTSGEERPGQILERHHLAEDSTRQANLEEAC